MGAELLARTGQGATMEEALEDVRAGFRAAGYLDKETRGPDDGEDLVLWPDLFRKGAVQVWPVPVPAWAADYMCIWLMENPPEGIDPVDKWGPWMAYPLSACGWMFFGWVNS